jgi:hypothetical protein
MNTQNFQNLIQAITGRPLLIKTNDEELQLGKEYIVGLTLPITQRTVSFKWKCAANEEKVLKSFITAFCNKYKEPNPAAYDWSAKNYGDKYLWANKSDIEKEYAYNHHSSNMYSNKALMAQIEANFQSDDIKAAYLKHGFYSTNYGLGIFALFTSQAVDNAINTLHSYLTAKAIPFSNEFSDARWVYRFKINLNKETHTKILSNFTE